MHTRVYYIYIYIQYEVGAPRLSPPRSAGLRPSRKSEIPYDLCIVYVCYCLLSINNHMYIQSTYNNSIYYP